MSSEGYSTDDDDEIETIKVVGLNMRMMGSAPRGELHITQLQYHQAKSVYFVGIRSP